MNLQNNLTSFLSMFFIAFAVLGLFIGPASATLLTSPVTDGTVTAVHDTGRHGIVNATLQTGRLQAELTKLGQTGVDVSSAQSDLTAGNLTAAMQWLMAYHKDHPSTAAGKTRPQFGNVTLQTGRLQVELTKLGQTGVDVSSAQSDLTAGNLTAAMQWLMAYHKDHPGMAGTITGRSSGNTTALKGDSGFAAHHAGAAGNMTWTRHIAPGVTKNT